MPATIPTELLMLLAQATPEHVELIRQFLLGRNPAGLPMGVSKPKDRFRFREAGGFFGVIFDGEQEFILPRTLGVRYLHYLLHHPNEPISAFDLELAVQPRKASARARDSIQAVTDPDAARMYLQDLARLRADREKSAAAGDLGEIDRIDVDMESLENALKGSATAADTGERARGNVSKAIATVRQRLRKGNKAERSFGEHLDRSLSTGYEILYAQEGGRIWGDPLN